MLDRLEGRAQIMDHDPTNPPSHDTEDSVAQSPTLLSPVLRAALPDSPERRQRRAEVEAALFGASEQIVAVGRFRLLERLGAGGMGAVYAAYDERLDRKIAVKLLHASQTHNDELRQRTLREARALARLSHPNVVHVYEVGEIEDQLFVAMEHLAGPTLRGWLREDERGWRAIVDVFRQAGEGLAAAHAEGIIHRDFKPHNVMFGADGRVRVLDFGLARLGLEPRSSSDSEDSTDADADAELTRSGTILGTPAYMAPEQLLGQPADARSDQFGFCVALFEALYGVRPFAGETLRQLIEAVTHGRMIETPAGSAVPQWLRKIVNRGLAREPARRFVSMRALLDALADDPSVQRRRWIAAAGAVGLLAGVWGLAASTHDDGQVCAGSREMLAGVWDDERSATIERALTSAELGYGVELGERVAAGLDDYTARWVEVRTEACEASQRGEQSGALLDLRMACLDDALVHVRETVGVLTELDRETAPRAVDLIYDLPRLERCSDAEVLTAAVPPPDDPEVAAAVVAIDERMARVEALQGLERWGDALAEVQAIIPEAEALGHGPQLVEIRLAEGYALTGDAKHEAGAEAFEEAFDAALDLGMTNEAALASAELTLITSFFLDDAERSAQWAKVADAATRLQGAQARPHARFRYLRAAGTAAGNAGDLVRAKALFDEQLALAEAELGPDTLENAYADLGILAIMSGDFEGAIEPLEHAVEIIIETRGSTHPSMARLQSSLAYAYRRTGRLDEARAANTSTLDTYVAIHGPDHDSVAMALTSRAHLASEVGDYDRARDDYQRALEIYTTTRGRESSTTAMAIGNLGSLAEARGDYEEAQRHFEDSLAIYEAALGPDHAEVARTVANLGSVVRTLGDHDRAEALLRRALSINDAQFGPDHAKGAYSRVQLAMLAFDRGDYEDARDGCERVYPIVVEAQGPNSRVVAFVRTTQGKAEYELGLHAESIEHLEQALQVRTTNETAPNDRAETCFALARSLWDAPENAGRDRARALALAEEARVGYAESGEDLAFVEAWLGERRSASP